MNFPVLFALAVSLALGFTFLNLPPVLDGLMALYGVSYAGVAGLLSALLWSHAACQVPAGLLADRLGLKPSLYLSLACLALGNGLPALAPSLPLAVVGRVITGFGTGWSFITTLKLVALNSPGGRAGVYQGLFGGFFSVGSIWAYLTLPSVAHWGWRTPYLSAAAVSLVVLALAFFLKPRPIPLSPVPPPSFTEILGHRTAWVIGLYHALSYGTILTLGNWVPSLLAEVSGTQATAGLAWGGALVMLVSGVGRGAGGLILFRLSSRTLANGSILLLGLNFLALFLARTPWLFLVLALSAAWFASITFGAFFDQAARSTTPQRLATVFGFINLLANLGAVAWTILFGLVKEGLGSFAPAFAVLALLSGLGLALGWRTLKD